MILIWIAIISVIGGGTFGTLMIVGSMLYAGKWTLPGTRQRDIQAAGVRKKIAELDAEAAEHRQRRDVIELQGDLQKHQLHAQLEAMQNAQFQRELEAKHDASSV